MLIVPSISHGSILALVDAMRTVDLKRRHGFDIFKFKSMMSLVMRFIVRCI